MKKRKIMTFLCLLFSVFFIAGCGKKQEKDATATAVQGETETATSEKNGEIQEEKKDSSETTTTEEASDTSDETAAEKEELDSVTVDGMSRDILANMTLEEKVGQMFLFGMDSLRGDGKTKKTKKLSESMGEVLEKYQPGGIFLYSKNMKDDKQTKTLIEDLQNHARVPVLVGTEERGAEDSKISTLSSMKMKDKKKITKLLSSSKETDVEEGASMVASYMKELGFHVNLLSGIGENQEEETSKEGKTETEPSYEEQRRWVQAFIRGSQKEGMAVMLFPFPAGISEAGDTRKGSLDIEETISELRKKEFQVFEGAIEEKTDFITVGHASYSLITENQTPASLSKLMTTEILRKELRYDGIIVTDSMNQKAITDAYTVSEAALKAVKAGADMLFYPDADGQEAYEAVLSAVKDGTIEESRIEESVMRILRMKISLGLIPEDTELIPK